MTNKPWPTCPVYECATCGREASVETLIWDQYEECYWCSVNGEDDHDCDGRMKWLRDEPAEFVSIAMYTTHRVYGGPEEGGWWYDAGNMIPRTLRNFGPEDWGKDSEEEGSAQWYHKELQKQAYGDNETNRRDRIEGRYLVTLRANKTAPGFFPAQRPIYS